MMLKVIVPFLRMVALLIPIVLFTGFKKYEVSPDNYVIVAYPTEKSIELLKVDSAGKGNGRLDRDQRMVSVINLKNSDKILYTGSSSIESYYAPDRKSWVNKLADFLDIILVPYGFSGKGADSIAGKLINDIPARIAGGVRPSEINATYVFCGQTLNSNDLINKDFDSAFIESNENLLRAAVTRLGAHPIIGTAYRTESRIWIENSLKKLADRWNADFIPIGSYHKNLIRNDKYAGFYGNGHPGIRTHDAYTLPLLQYFMQMERPKQAILIFEARDATKDISTLVYNDNFERAELFRSIQVGEMSLDSDCQDMYDRLDERGGYTIRRTNTSDYMKLFKKQAISLKDKSLVEVIIPKVRPDTVSIHLSQTGGKEVYLFDHFAYAWELVPVEEGCITFSESKYIGFDKVKLLLVGSDVTLADISVDVINGFDKPEKSPGRIMPPLAGKTIFDSGGFDHATKVNWDLGNNKLYNQTDKLGSEFADIPAYLGDTKEVLVLSDSLKRTFTLDKVGSFGYRTLRIWTCARLNPPIYNPDRYASWKTADNPFTDVSWYDEDKYDYDDLQVIVKYKGEPYGNLAKSVNRQKVGLFWHLGYVDVLLPIVSDGSYELQISRGSNHNTYDMELCDVKIELL